MAEQVAREPDSNVQKDTGLHIPYAFIPPSHAFHLPLENLRTAVSAWQQAKPIPPLAECLRTRSLIRAQQERNGEWKLKWAYFSAQSLNEAHQRFWARTWLYRASRDKTELYEFPSDPKLAGPSQVLSDAIETMDGRTLFTGASVLRYVPRRRLTICFPQGFIGKQPQCVGKFVRLAEAEALFQRMTFVYQLSRRASLPFDLAEPLNIDAQHGLLFQKKCPGKEMAGTLGAHNYQILLRQAGMVHAHIHMLERSGLAVWEPATFISSVRRDIDWILFLWPKPRSILETVWNEWSDDTPHFDPHDFTFCHGDFRAPHLLLPSASMPSVVDFDGACLGEPHLELALFVTSLQRDTTLFAEPFEPGDGQLRARAIEAYVSGYQEIRPGFDARRFVWFHLACEIHFLARTLQRDLGEPLSLDRSIERIQELRGCLGRKSRQL